MFLSKDPMRKPILTLATITSLLFAVAAQADGWRSLQQASFEEVETDQGWLVRKAFPDSLRDAAPDFEIEGFLVPAVPEPFLKTFLLVQTPLDCPFCGESASPTSVLEVTLATPIQPREEFSRLRVAGRLEFIESTMTTQLFRLVDARVID